MHVFARWSTFRCIMRERNWTTRTNCSPNRALEQAFYQLSIPAGALYCCDACFAGGFTSTNVQKCASSNDLSDKTVSEDEKKGPSLFLIRMEQKEKSPKLGSSAAMETLGDSRLPRRSRQFSRLTRLRLLVWGFSSRRSRRRAAPSCFRRHQRPSGGGSSPWLPSPPRPTVRTGQSCWALPCRR